MAHLAALVNDFLANEFDISPVNASGLGLTEYDERLDDMSADAFHRRDADAAEWLKRFESAAGELSADDEIDRQLAISALRGRLIGADWEVWRRDPTTYSGPVLNGLFGLFLNRLRPTADLVDEGRNGRIIDPLARTECARVLRDLAADADLRRDMGVASRERACMCSAKTAADSILIAIEAENSAGALADHPWNGYR